MNKKYVILRVLKSGLPWHIACPPMPYSIEATARRGRILGRKKGVTSASSLGAGPTVLKHPVDVTVANPINPTFMTGETATVTDCLDAAEQRKHHTNDDKCVALHRKCLPLVTTRYGGWGRESTATIERISNLMPRKTESRYNTVFCIFTEYFQFCSRCTKNGCKINNKTIMVPSWLTDCVYMKNVAVGMTYSTIG